MTNFIIRYLNITLAAILAGISLGIWIGFNPMNLSLMAYIEQQQNMLNALRGLMVGLVIAATVVTIVSAGLQRRNRGSFIPLAIAALFFVACILITRFGNKPIDDLVMSWTSTSFPSNWADFRAHWWSLHIMRTITESIAFLLITAVSIKKN